MTDPAAEVDFGDAAIPGAPSGTGDTQIWRDLILSNAGNADLPVGRATITADGGDFTAQGRAATLAPGATQRVVVDFAPADGVRGKRTGTLALTIDGVAVEQSLTGDALDGVGTPGVTLSLSQPHSIIFPEDDLTLHVTADTNWGNISSYQWTVYPPGGRSWDGGARTEPADPLSGSHPFTVPSLEPATLESPFTYRISVMATHENGLTGTADLDFVVEKSTEMRTLHAQAMPTEETEVWFTPSEVVTKDMEVARHRE